MDDIEQYSLTEQLDSAKQLYAELFVLLELSVNEDPETRNSNQLDLAIANLQGRIDVRMGALRQEYDRAGKERRLSAALQQSILDFETSLRDGLQIMNSRITRRMTELAEERDQIRDQLNMVHRKQTGAKGYRQRANTSMLMESKM